MAAPVRVWVARGAREAPRPAPCVARRFEIHPQATSARRTLRAVQLLPGHSKLDSTVRYLGIEVDDALEISEQAEIRSRP